MDRALLRVENVSVRRPGAEVLRKVNLEVERGEVHALLGLNGSGKTSLALTLMGAEARHVPVVVVRDDQARVTHEAAIGSVGRQELETLMARGLSEEDAVDIIIRGMLRA